MRLYPYASTYPSQFGPQFPKYLSAFHNSLVTCLLGGILLSTGCGRGFDSDTARNPELPRNSTKQSPNAGSLEGNQFTPSESPPPSQRTAAEIIAGFKQLPPDEINDTALAELCALDEAVTEFAALDCSKSRITNAGLNHIAKLKQLQALKIDSTRITPAGVQEVASLPQLQSLSMRGVPHFEIQLANFDAAVAALVEVKTLTDLDLSGTRLSVAGLASIGKMVQLRRLALNDTRLTDSGLAQLKGLVDLEVLEINRTLIGDAGFAHLMPLTKLHTLSMSETEITGAGFAGLANQPRINGFRKIDASKTGFGRQGILGLRGAKSLEVLRIDTAGMTDDSLQVIKGCVNLRELQLSNNPGITDAGLSNLNGLTKLELLGLNSVPRITDRGLGILRNHKQLKQLGVNGSNCTLNGIQQLKQLLPEVKVVFQGQEI